MQNVVATINVVFRFYFFFLSSNPVTFLPENIRIDIFKGPSIKEITLYLVNGNVSIMWLCFISIKLKEEKENKFNFVYKVS